MPRAMVKDSKRREVARRLRDAAKRDGSVEFDGVDSLESCVFGEITCSTWASILHSLADLVDRPTCENVSEFGSHTVTVSNFAKDESFGFVCSRCGIRLMSDEMGSSPLIDEKFAHHALRYCPNCGAEVVK